MANTKYAGVSITTRDNSLQAQTTPEGVVGVIGITERGEVGVPKLITSTMEYYREFGGLLENSNFPLLCLRILNAGGSIMVVRIAHYTDITDKTTIAGVKATGTLGVQFEAKNIGGWGNAIKIKITEANTGDTTKVDITISVGTDTSLTQVISDFPKTVTLTDKDDFFNSVAKYVNINTLATLTTGEITLSQGSQDITGILTADYIGNSAGTGLHSFDDTQDIVRISVIDKAIPEIDTAVANYVKNRGDIMGVIHTPIALDGETAITYREGTGAYAGHTAIDYYGVILIMGGLTIENPNGNGTINITAVADVLGLMGKRDTESFAWLSIGGAKRGKINDVLGVVYNVNTSSRQAIADKIVARGIIPVIYSQGIGVVVWGNTTLQKTDTLLKQLNIAELVLYLMRELKKLVASSLFEANDITTWVELHLKVFPFLDRIVENRGIAEYKYYGDQEVQSINDVKINTLEGIARGEYKMIIQIRPNGALTFIDLNIGVTDKSLSINIEE